MAGLLDILSSGGSSGGLLDFLRQNALNQQFQGLQPSDTAQYAPPMQAPVQQPILPTASSPQVAQPSPLDTAQWPYGPNGAPSQANAMMPTPQSAAAPAVAAQPPQPVQQPLAGLGDHLSAGLQSFANTDKGGLIGKLINGFGGLASGQRTDPAFATQNLTARALLAKGFDLATVQAAIANPEVMKTLVTQAYGPAQNLGSGYIMQNGKVTRAYTPDDKTPAGFAQDDNGTMHFVPGGPADPAYIRLKAAQAADPNAVHVLGKGGELYKVDANGNATVVHKNEDNIEASLDDATTNMMAKQYLAGDKSVLTNLGRGAQGAANIVKLRSAIKAEADKQGLDGNDVAQRFIDYAGDTARERTAATQEGRMSPAGIEAHGAIQLGRLASDAVPRGNWVPINKVIQAYEQGTSDPALRAFGSANTTIINTYARAINPNGVGTVADKEHARQMLSTADGPAAYKAVLDQLDKEIEMAHQSPSQARAGFKQERQNRLNGVSTPPTLPGTTPAAVPATPASKPVPQPGDIQDGYRFKGGNPADPKNWEQIS